MDTSKEPIFSKPTITIFVCTMIIRAVTIGYVIGGFVIKFHLNYLDTEIVFVMDHMTLDTLPLGSTLMFLIYSLMPFLLLYAVVGGVSLLLLVRRTRGLLLTHAIGHSILILIKVVYLFLFLWIVIETSYDSTLTNDFAVVHNSKENTMGLQWDYLSWLKFFETLKCCNVTGEAITNVYIGNYGYLCKFTSGCLDVITNITTSYGSYYIVAISINIISSVVCVGITEYFFRIAELKKKKELTTKELFKCSNGMLGELHKMSATTWKSNKTKWISGFLKIFDFTYEVSLGCSCLILTYSWLVDHYLKSVIYAVWKDGISMGYMENILLITFLCVVLISLCSKILHFTALYRKSKFLLSVDIIVNFFLVLVELVILTFAIFLVRMLYCCITGNDSYHCQFLNTDKFAEFCSNDEGIWSRAVRNVWLSFVFLLLHMALKIVQLVMADRLFKNIQTEQEKKHVGFLHHILMEAKRKPLVAANVAVGTFAMVFSCIFLCGLLVVRYDQNAYERITNTLHGILYTDTYLNIGDLRDSSYIIMIVTLILTFLNQIVLFIGVYLEKSYLLIGFFGTQIFLSLLQVTSLILISFPLRLIYCCIEGVDQCQITSDKDDVNILCSGQSDLWISTSMELWLFLSFTLGSFIIQVSSIVLSVKLFRKLFPEMGLYMKCVQLWKRMKSWIANNKKMFIISLCLSTLIIEVGFGIAIYVYSFKSIFTSELENYLGRFYYRVFNMRYLMDGQAYTLTIIIPMSAFFRPLLFWLLYVMKKVQTSHIFVIGYLVFVVGELIMLIPSGLLLNLAYDCKDLYSSPYTSNITLWTQFCSSCKEAVYNMEAISISFLICHLIINIIFIIIINELYPVLQEDEENKGVFRVWWNGLKSQFVDGKVQRLFKIIQWFNACVEVTFGIVVFTLYFRNFYPLDAHVQQALGNFGKHRYDMQDLLNAVSYTFMTIIPMTLCFRVVFLLAGLYQRQFFIFIIITIFFVITGGHLVLLTQSSYLLDLAYNCFDRHSSHYSSTAFSLFCDTNIQFVLDIASVFICYLVIQIVLNVLSLVIVNRVYMYSGKSPASKGAFSTACERLLFDMQGKRSKIRIAFLVVFAFMLIVRALFWIGLVLMGLSPGYIHTDLIDKMYSMHIGDMNYGRTSMALMYSHLAVVPLDIACHCLESISMTRMSKLFLFISVLLRVIWIASDIVVLILSSLILNLAYCLCGPGPNCNSPFTEQKETVCRNSYLLFSMSGVMVAYVVVNICSHIFEISVCTFWSKKTIPTPKISPIVNGTHNQLNDVQISDFEENE